MGGRRESVVVGLEGEIDLDRAPEVRRLLLDRVAAGKDVLVDLSAVTYIDSSGIAALIEALQTARNGGATLELVSVSEQAMRVLQLARLDKVFIIHADLAAARSEAP